MVKHTTPEHKVCGYYQRHPKTGEKINECARATVRGSDRCARHGSSGAGRAAARRAAASFVWRHRRPAADADHKARREYGISFDRCQHCGDAIVKAGR